MRSRTVRPSRWTRALWAMALAGAGAGIPATRCPAATASFRLTSPQDGGRVAAGAVISWTITVALSGNDNAGLALALVDLVQSPGNPTRVDIPPAAGVPPALAAFSRPLGISNPGDGPTANGYLGLERGPAGGRDLIQIGGAQNTFGFPGLLQGAKAVVTPGIATGREVVLAQGTFAVPQTPGNYTFSLSNPLANGLEAPLAGSAWSVRRADVEILAGSVSFTVGGSIGFVRGDANGDGRPNIADASYVLGFLFLGSPRELPCPASADTDGNLRLDLSDAVALLNYLFLGGARPAPPFPACGIDSRPGAIACTAFPPCN